MSWRQLKGSRQRAVDMYQQPPGLACIPGAVYPCVSKTRFCILLKPPSNSMYATHSLTSPCMHSPLLSPRSPPTPSSQQQLRSPLFHHPHIRLQIVRPKPLKPGIEVHQRLLHAEMPTRDRIPQVVHVATLVRSADLLLGSRAPQLVVRLEGCLDGLRAGA